METVTGWTGETACALQAALRMSNETFARHLRVSVRTVAGWHEKPDGRAATGDAAASRRGVHSGDPGARDRFAALCGEPVPSTQQRHRTRSSRERSDATPPPSTGSSPTRTSAKRSQRLDDLAGWEPGTARRQVAMRLGRLDRRYLLDRAESSKAHRDSVRSPRPWAATTGAGQGLRAVRRRCPVERVTTSVLTHPDWLDLECPLTAGNDRLTLRAPAVGRDRARSRRQPQPRPSVSPRRWLQIPGSLNRPCTG